MKKSITFQTFNEQFYLKKNPDVLGAVKAGDFKSGWHHYLEFGYKEQRKGIININDFLLPVTQQDNLKSSPPLFLIERVHGTKDKDRFYLIGKNIAHIFKKTWESESINLLENSNILDFGCGCGRIITWLHELYPDCNYYGTDIDNEAISWCQNNIADLGKFTVNRHLPKLDFPEQFFDLVYAISVFTHLPEDMQLAWLEELARITKKDGYLLLTIHDDNLFPLEFKQEREKLNHKGFYFLVGSGTKGLPDFYQTAFHNHCYIENVWNQFFAIKHIIRKGILNHQDIVVCQKN